MIGEEDSSDLKGSGIPLSQRGRSHSSFTGLKGLQCGLRNNSSLAIEHRTSSVMERRKRKCEIGASNLSSLMKLDSVQYMPLGGLTKSDVLHDENEVCYGSTSFDNIQGRSMTY